MVKARPLRTIWRTACADRGVLFLRNQRLVFAKRPLHKHRVHPLAVFVAHLAQHADMLESKARMQRDRPGVATVADHRDELAPRPRVATFDQRRQQRETEAAPTETICDIT